MQPFLRVLVQLPIQRFEFETYHVLQPQIEIDVHMQLQMFRPLIYLEAKDQSSFRVKQVQLRISFRL